MITQAAATNLTIVSANKEEKEEPAILAIANPPYPDRISFETRQRMGVERNPIFVLKGFIPR